MYSKDGNMKKKWIVACFILLASSGGLALAGYCSNFVNVLYVAIYDESVSDEELNALCNRYEADCL